MLNNIQHKGFGEKMEVLLNFVSLIYIDKWARLLYILLQKCYKLIAKCINFVIISSNKKRKGVCMQFC